MGYIIITDSGANLTDKIIKDNQIKILSLSFRVGEQEFLSYQEDVVTDNKKYYQMMREGEVITTTLINYDACLQAFDEILAQGNDLLYIGFSSGLSGSYNVTCLVADELRQKYPDRKIYTVDTLAASMGQGLLVYYALQHQKDGMDIDTLKQWLEDTKLKINHWFTVDDLMFLKRGGRVKAATAIAGTILGIKPVLHVDDEGHLIARSKVRGRRASIDALVAQAQKNIVNPKEQMIFISHGDCLEDALYLEKQVKEKLKVKDTVINYIDPVIGAHSGPGTLALFYIGASR